MGFLSWLTGAGTNYNPDRDIPDLSGKVILVTGGNAGLGKATIAQLIKHSPSKIFLAARSASKASTAIAELKKQTPSADIVHLPLDLSSFTSIASAAKLLESQTSRLDILLNNAGIMLTPFSRTPEGYEIQFGTNHMGHALLTKLLLPLLLRTAEESGSDVRVINLSSAGHHFATLSGGVITSAEPWSISALERVYSGVRYGSSKLANLLHARELASRYPQITAVALHPGSVDTALFDETYGLWRRLPGVGEAMAGRIKGGLTTVDEGAYNQLWACSAPKAEVRRAWYYNPVGQGSRGGFFTGQAEAERLWGWTEKELQRHGY